MRYKMNGRIYKATVDATELMNCSSKHGFVRTMERADKNEQQALRMIQNAWTRGKSSDQLQLTKQKKYVSHYNSLTIEGYTNLRVYCGYLFIFSSAGRLITMHPLPKDFDKKYVYDGKTRVRDARRYSRFNEEEEYEAYEVYEEYYEVFS